MAFVPIDRDRPAINPPPRRRGPPPKPVQEPVEPKHDDYVVGYARPPKQHQFRPGRSGNPKGRPRGARGMNTIVRELLTAKVTVRTADGPKKMQKMEAVLHKLMEKAFAGDLRALGSIIQLYRASVNDDVDQTGISATGLAAAQEDDALAALCQLIRDDVAGQQQGEPS